MIGLLRKKQRTYAQSNTEKISKYESTAKVHIKRFYEDFEKLDKNSGEI